MAIQPNPVKRSDVDILLDELTDEQRQRYASAQLAAATLAEWATDPIMTEDIIDLADYIGRGWITEADVDDELGVIEHLAGLTETGTITDDAIIEQDSTDSYASLEHDFQPAEAAPAASYIGANTLDRP